MDRVEGSILELIDSTMPLKLLLNAEFFISAFKPGFKKFIKKAIPLTIVTGVTVSYTHLTLPTIYSV